MGAFALEQLGWTPEFEKAFAAHAGRGLIPARVAVEHRSRYQLLSAEGEFEAVLAGALRHAAPHREEQPAVGDWVAVQRTGGDVGRIEGVLRRRSAFTRGAPGRGHERQVVAANIDAVFVVTSLNAEFNPRRLERYLALARESGARPVIVLSKADLVADPSAFLEAVRGSAPGTRAIVTSAVTGRGVAEVREELAGHRTGALLGSSGVGKSTLINALVGYERQTTAAVREADARGRHTTTRRELVLLPGGGILIDTPGMRELQLADSGDGVLATFEDIESLAGSCAFRDCSHGPEPGCAVLEAVAQGRLDPGRLDSYRKLRSELEERVPGRDRRARAGRAPPHGRGKHGVRKESA